ncbi:MAG: recombination protein O N-terminal domain-containing protein [Thalassobaculum sp.]
MIDWQDTGIVLSARPHGEGSAVVSLLTAEHGRHAGLARGAFSSRGRGVYQPGNRVLRRPGGPALPRHLGALDLRIG